MVDQQNQASNVLSNLTNTSFNNSGAFSNLTTQQPQQQSNLETSTIDKTIADLQKQFDSLSNEFTHENYYKFKNENRKKWVVDWLKNNAGWSLLSPLFIGGIGSAVQTGRADQQTKQWWNEGIEKKNLIFKQLEEAKAQRQSYLSNLELQRNKYINEQESLKKAGINNPYFMLRNGLINNSSPIGLTGAGRPNFGGFDKGKFSSFHEFLEMLLLMSRIGKNVRG